MNELEIRIERIRQDRVHGASELAFGALGILEEAVQNSLAESIREFEAEIFACASKLAAVRPTMAVIANCIDRFIKLFKQLLPKHQTLVNLRLHTRQVITDITSAIANERNETIARGAALISNNMVVMTCSYSSVVIAVLKMAAGQNKSIRVLALASHNSCCYAQMTVNRLDENGIIGDVFPEEELPEILPMTDLILTGADAITPDTLINGSPSLALALAARKCKPPVPFYAICEPLKFTPSLPPVLEPGFDLIPIELLTGVVSAK